MVIILKVEINYSIPKDNNSVYVYYHAITKIELILNAQGKVQV